MSHYGRLRREVRRAEFRRDMGSVEFKTVYYHILAICWVRPHLWSAGCRLLVTMVAGQHVRGCTRASIHLGSLRSPGVHSHLVCHLHRRYRRPDSHRPLRRPDHDRSFHCWHGSRRVVRYARIPHLTILDYSDSADSYRPTLQRRDRPEGHAWYAARLVSAANHHRVGARALFCP